MPEIQVKDKLITLEELGTAINAKAGVTSVNNQTGAVSITPANIGAVATSAVIDIPHGGTGATTPAVVITNEYTSVLDVINSIVNTRVFPISVQKNGLSIYNDMPTGFEGNEWNMVLTGDLGRCTALLYIYPETSIFKRDYFAGAWANGWIKVSPITPGDIGGVAKSGDTMTGDLTISKDTPNLTLKCPNLGNLSLGIQIGPTGDHGLYSTGYWNGSEFVADWRWITYINNNGNIFQHGQWDGDVINVAHGGTGATQGTIDITDFCTFPTGNVATAPPFGGRLYYNPYLNCVFGTIIMEDNASIDNQANIAYLRKDSSGTPLIANRAAACGVCVHTDTIPVIPRISGDTIISSHTSGVPITTPRYTIMAFLG